MQPLRLVVGENNNILLTSTNLLFYSKNKIFGSNNKLFAWINLYKH